MVKGPRIANRILVGFLGGSGAEDCGGSAWWVVGFWPWRLVSSCGFQAMEIGAFLWVSEGGDQLGFWVSRSVCCGGGLWPDLNHLSASAIVVLLVKPFLISPSSLYLLCTEVSHS